MITDELMAWWVRKFPIMDKELHEDFTAIADRIDAEHEREVADTRNDALFRANEKAMAEHGFVRLPKDADGEYIHVGDTVEWMPYDETYQPVIRTVSGVGAGVFFAWSGEKCQYAQYDAQAYRHYRQSTVEAVLREFAGTLASAENNWGSDVDDAIAKFAAKLRLAGDAE